MAQPVLNLSLAQSNALKGIALILLLIHHLFFKQFGLYDDIYIGSYPLVQTVGILCKVCVALFVFLSGYGLGAGQKEFNQKSIKKFYIRRFTKLYLNYWLIWLLFIPIGIAFFNQSFEAAYGDKLYYLPLDFLGVLNILGVYGMNPTWWFYSCIIVLYLVFPLIGWLIGRYPLSCIPLLIMSVLIVFVPYTFLGAVKWYVFPFILGIMSAKCHIINVLPPPLSHHAEILAEFS